MIAELISWIATLGDTRSERSAGAPLPQRVVRRLGGGDDDLTDTGLYSIATHAHTEQDAATEAERTAHRMMLLGGQIPIPTETGPLYIDDITATDGPVVTRWADHYRSITTYEIAIRTTALEGDNA